MHIDRQGGSSALHVLLLEDNPGDAELVRTYLQGSSIQHFDLEHADRFQEGLEHIRHAEPDVLLLDLNLRDTGAHETIARLGELPDDLPVVVLTGGDRDALELDALKQGVEEFLEKDNLGPELLAKRIEHALERQHYQRELRLIRRAVDAAEEGVVISDARRDDDPIIHCNQGFLELTGYDEDEVVGYNCRFLQCDDTDPETVDRLRDAIASNEPITVDILNARKDGSEFWNELSIAPVRDETGAVTHYVGFQRDVTRRVEAESQLRQRTRELEQYYTIVENTTDAVAIMDREGRYQLVNTSIEELFGLPKEKIEGRHIEDVLDDEIASRIAERNEQVIETESGHTFEEQFTFQKEEHTFLTTYLPYHEDGEFMGTCVIARDITERKAMRDELEHQALYDSLTHLPNRALFEDRLEQAARRSKRLEKTFAVAYVDLDDFKVVNDSFGHPAGDRLLKRVADRLCKAIREEDTVARIGGDEFMLLLEGIESRRDLEIVGERLRGTFTPPFEVEGVDVHLSASIGFAYPDTPCWGGGEVEEGHLEQLVRIADRAMYDIKASGKTSWQIFDVSERDSAGGRIHRENEIRRAIQDDEFVAHYQPIYRLADGSIAAAEVLARWRDPDDGFVSPGRFIPIAEQSALIAKLGEAIFECACRDFAGLQLREDAETFHLFVNLSPRQVESYESMERLVEMARNDAPESLKFHFEVTETDLLENYEQVRRLQDEGFGILVDDFGTGHSSLSRFKRMPVDGLKLDMEFVHGMLDSPVDAAIVETITELGLRLDIPVIAEGIETEGQLQMLKDIDCTAAQGYHLARPQPFDEVSELLSRELTPLGLRE